MNEVLRQEKKFLITIQQLYKLKQQFSQVMSEDSHNGADGYLVRSLYFDSLEDRDYEEKQDGVELRRKIRLRNYGPGSDMAVLEMKQKQGAMQKKRSLKMSREDAARLAEREYSVLLKYKESFALELYTLMNMYCYQPRAVVEYRRFALIAKENKIRITFDHLITATESRWDIFANDLLLNSVLDPTLAVLEVKYNGFLLSYIKEMLQICNESEISVGKYCMGRMVSKHYRF